MSDKIHPHHLQRRAILYVRQSSTFQATHNRESQKLQYAMQARLHQLGWAEVEVVDEDLGRSASGSVARAGFERMVAEVCLGRVGAVAAREVSRFARNSRDWQQLVEVCRLVDTLLIDQESVYSPRLSNDRLLLGLKGSLNEYERDLLRQRARRTVWERPSGNDAGSRRCNGSRSCSRRSSNGRRRATAAPRRRRRNGLTWPRTWKRCGRTPAVTCACRSGSCRR